MSNNKKNKKIIRLIVVLISISIMFGIGFIVGGALIYNEKELELSELKNQIDILKDNDNYKNINYYNDTSLSIIYEDDWEPSGFKDKNINYISYQFKYTYGYEIIYQRSVYIECLGYFYIISLSSVLKKNILDEKNDYFWENINVIL